MFPFVFLLVHAFMQESVPPHVLHATPYHIIASHCIASHCIVQTPLQRRRRRHREREIVAMHNERRDQGREVGDSSAAGISTGESSGNSTVGGRFPSPLLPRSHSVAVTTATTSHALLPLGFNTESTRSDSSSSGSGTATSSSSNEGNSKQRIHISKLLTILEDMLVIK